MTFDLDSLTVSSIRDEQEYAGQRAVLQAYLGKARIRLQVDVGFGDVVTPNPEKAEYPTLIGGVPVPTLRTYPRVVTVAEKFEAMVHLGRRNSRMRDFHDIWALSEEFPFEGETLREAVSNCFERRRTAWTSEIPDALQPAFYSSTDLQSRWQAYIRRGGFCTPPPRSLQEIGERIRGFLLPVRNRIVSGLQLEMQWHVGGPWQAGGFPMEGEADE